MLDINEEEWERLSKSVAWYRIVDNIRNEDIKEEPGTTGINTGKLIKDQKKCVEHFEEWQKIEFRNRSANKPRARWDEVTRLHVYVETGLPRVAWS